MSPLTLQNIREQMALSLERTKQLEDQVKLLPELKEQLSTLKEENQRLLTKLKDGRTEKLNSLNKTYNRQRSQSFTDDLDGLDSLTSRKVTPPKKDCGVMCGVLTRNVGVGHQNPNTKSVSTSTLDTEGFADKWLHEKAKLLNSNHLLSAPDSYKKFTVSKDTQTQRKIAKDASAQFKFEPPPVPKHDQHCQTAKVRKSVNHVGVLVKTRSSDVSIQKIVDSCTVGSSEDTVDSIICDNCNKLKKTVGVGPDRNEDAYTSPVSLALLNSRSKSFNLGEDRLNLTRTRTIGCQYDKHSTNRSCQADIKLKSHAKSCQSEPKLSEKSTQYERNSASKGTDMFELIPSKRHVGCEAKETKPTTTDAASNTHEYMCGKCEKEKDEMRDSFKKEGGSPTPSRIPRPQIPTTPVETRKLRRQDTYTKVYGSPTEQHSPLTRLSGLDLSPKGETSPIDKVKQNFKQLADVSTSPGAQNGVSSTPITKVHVQEITLPVSESTIFQPIHNQNRKKAVPSKEMQGAMKVLNDMLQKTAAKNLKNHSATNIIQQEWFTISSLITANPLDVEDYLDALEDMSSHLLEFVVNLSDSSGNTAMHYAVSHSNFDVVSILLDSKVCDINKPNKAGYTSVMLVSLAEVNSQTHANVVRRLFQLADVNIRASQHGQTALMLAVSHGHLDMVKMLLEAGADINIQDEDGSTALMCAAEHGHIEIVKHFLSHPDCDSTLTDVDGSTALKIAMEAGHKHIGVLLYAHERNLQKAHSGKLKKTKSLSPKTPLSPLAARSNRALNETRPK
ncbi:unnamed protein product [Acanthoscelides obtectus]|nr:unnamed protein product [Acanthoscelides obtectus]CAK1629178.1 KN motif and ankyrin repeat domain-containing protein 1 [Acanthoscelides obtectus]